MDFNISESSVEISMPQLCLFASRRGNIGSLSQKSFHPKDKFVSKYLEKKLLESAFRNNSKELSSSVDFDGVTYKIKDSADSFYFDGEKCSLELVRSISQKNLSLRPDNFSAVRLISLGYLATRQLDIDCVELVFTNVSNESCESNSIVRVRDKEYLEEKFFSYLSKIHPAVMLEIERKKSDLPSIEKIKFPFPSIRKGQRDLIEMCYGAICRNEILFAAAPTGTGKTISTLYPAIKAMARGKCDKIFYLTAKSSTRREAFSAIKKMHEAGARIRAIILSPKEYMCKNDTGRMIFGVGEYLCSAEKCPLARGYYDRVDAAVSELLSKYNGFTPSLIFEAAAKYSICPYELSLDLSQKCDVIICDYNYVYDPRVYLRRYFDVNTDDTSPPQKYVFLIDEAHNLLDRAREMYSSALCRSSFEKLFSVIPREEKTLNESLINVIKGFHKLRWLCSDNIFTDEHGIEHGFYISREPLMALNEALEAFSKTSSLWLSKNQSSHLHQSVNTLNKLVRDYETIMLYYDDAFRTYVTIDGGDTEVRLFCLDPSRILNICHNRSISTILFSATLTPIDYFADVLGGGRGYASISLPSPFSSDNLCIAATRHISTRYEDRERSVPRIVSAIAAVVSKKKGNYIVYLPSYSYLQNVVSLFGDKFPSVPIKVQTRNMSLSEKEDFLNFFEDDEGVLRIGFCVLGGSFSEGVDLPGGRLIGSIIIGVGLPGLSNEQNIIREFYDIKCERGYDYAYTYPGMNKVLQASGRVIRREDDRGVVVLIDDRYDSTEYRSLFPEHWRDIKFADSASSLSEIIEDFWRNTLLTKK